MPVAELYYVVECVCGTVARGVRTAKSQQVACVNCRRPVFVFPQSPLPDDLLGSLAHGTAPEVSALKLPDKAAFWLVPASAAIVALAVVGVVIASIVRTYRPTANGIRQLTTSEAGNQVTARLDAARAAVAEGAYRLALQELEAASKLQAEFPASVASDTARQIRLWHKQVALLADLASESVEEIMRHALGQSDKEWQAVFRERYAGRSIVIDSRVFRDAAGRFHIDYQLHAGGLSGEWDVQSLALFARLPLQRPQRIVFGIRLADISRSARDRWTVRPEPNSAVLFTDESILAGLSIPMDNDLREVLRRQAAWDIEE